MQADIRFMAHNTRSQVSPQAIGEGLVDMLLPVIGIQDKPVIGPTRREIEGEIGMLFTVVL